MRGLKLFAILFSFSAFPWKAVAWGERGHHSICNEASRLVKEEGLKEFLKTRGHIMGHTCNVPDIHWKSLPSELTRIGNPTHFIEPDLVGFAIKDTPTLFDDFLRMLAGAGEASQLVHKVGTLWWRTEQFFNISLESASRIQESPLPLNGSEEQQNALPYNEAIYGMMTHMGIMGHFVGDSSMPYHNWADYDGYGAGHGGIHAYYESICPGEFGSELDVELRALALGLPDFSESYSPAELIKKIGIEAVNEVEVLQKLDTILEPSTQSVNEHGMTMRKPAVRPAPSEQCPNFKPLMLLQMARSAKTLAHLWDEIYVQAGRPNLAAYKSYRYPLTPDYVEPKYLNQIPTE